MKPTSAMVLQEAHEAWVRGDAGTRDFPTFSSYANYRLWLWGYKVVNR